MLIMAEYYMMGDNVFNHFKQCSTKNNNYFIDLNW